MMALNKMNFDPDNGFQNSGSYPDPSNENETREQLMRPHKQMQTFVNNLIELLNTSGASNIYAEPLEGVNDSEGNPITTISGQLQWFLDNKVYGGQEIQAIRLNDSNQCEFYNGESWKILVGNTGPAPTVNIEEIDNGVKITITGDNGPQSFELFNGPGIPDGGLQNQFLMKTDSSTEWHYVFNDTMASDSTTYSSNKIDEKVGSIIDDDQDQSLTTTLSAKTITDGINATKSTMKTITVQPSEWVDGVYTLVDDLITETSYQEWLPPLKTETNTAVIEAIQNANIVDYGQSAGQAQIFCMGTVPTIEVQFRVIFRSEKVTWSEVDPQPTDTGIHYELNTEQDTGDYWIDGKKIYQITTSFENISNGNNKSYPVSNVSEVIDLTAVYYAEETWNSMNRPWANSGRDVVQYHTTQSSIIVTNSNGNITLQKVYVTMKYTKTEGSES